MSDDAATGTTPFVGPHGSFWVDCDACAGRGGWEIEDDEGGFEECWRCHGNGGYWDCIDDLCASLIYEWNG